MPLDSIHYAIKYDGACFYRKIIKWRWNFFPITAHHEVVYSSYTVAICQQLQFAQSTIAYTIKRRQSAFGLGEETPEST